jgi:diguanylate cyclase (GGDEF)-like protein/PAS domain S-box-containing protein
MFESSLEAMLLASPEGKIFRANQMACRMLQRTELELMECGLGPHLDFEDPRTMELLAERQRQGRVMGELQLLQKNGEKFPARFSSALFRDEMGKLWAVINLQDRTAEILQEEKLRGDLNRMAYLSQMDFLSGVLNRKGFLDRLAKEMERAKREHASLGLILFDIDAFKNINNQHGRRHCDHVLKEFVEDLSNDLRPYDTFARYGGDEFVACLPGTNYENTCIVAERLRSGLEKRTIELDHVKVQLTASFGVAVYEDYEKSIDALISEAESNMLRAKSEKNMVCGY